MSEIMTYPIDNQPYDLATEEFETEHEHQQYYDDDENLSEVSIIYDEENILENEHSNIDFDLINDMKDAQRLGMTLDELYNMYNEINNHQEEICNYAPEWPFDHSSGYQDEGLEECM